MRAAAPATESRKLNNSLRARTELQSLKTRTGSFSAADYEASDVRSVSADASSNCCTESHTLGTSPEPATSRARTPGHPTRGSTVADTRRHHAPGRRPVVQFRAPRAGRRGHHTTLQADPLRWASVLSPDQRRSALTLHTTHGIEPRYGCFSMTFAIMAGRQGLDGPALRL
jgi:hypothetical protein